MCAQQKLHAKEKKSHVIVFTIEIKNKNCAKFHKKRQNSKWKEISESFKPSQKGPLGSFQSRKENYPKRVIDPPYMENSDTLIKLTL